MQNVSAERSCNILMHTVKPHRPLCCSARWFHKQTSLPAAQWLVGFTRTSECAVFPQLGWSRQSHKKHESERLNWTLNWPFAQAASIVVVIIRWLYVRHASAFQVYLALVEEKQDAKSVKRIRSWHWHGILSMWKQQCWLVSNETERKQLLSYSSDYNPKHWF